MNPLTLANAVANAVVVFAVAGMAIRVFGDPKHNIHQHPELFWIRKFISSLVICGGVLNLFTLSTPSWTEIVLNYGFAGNYLFSLYYHDRVTSPKHSTNAAALPKRRTPRRPSNTGKGKPHSSSRGAGR